MRLDGNTILITGGSAGIGLALAKRFVRAGSTVVVCGRRREQLERARAECPGLHALPCDVASEAERAELAARALRDFPALNVLVNNAGVQNRPPPLARPQS